MSSHIHFSIQRFSNHGRLMHKSSFLTSDSSLRKHSQPKVHLPKTAHLKTLISAKCTLCLLYSYGFTLPLNRKQNWKSKALFLLPSDSILYTNYNNTFNNNDLSVHTHEREWPVNSGADVCRKWILIGCQCLYLLLNLSESDPNDIIDHCCCLYSCGVASGQLIFTVRTFGEVK